MLKKKKKKKKKKKPFMWIKDGILVLKKVIYKICLNWGSLSIKRILS